MNCSSCIYPRKMVRAGKDRNNQQRWKCAHCGSVTTSRNGLPRGVYPSRRPTFDAAAELFKQGTAVRAVARQLEIRPRTARRWKDLIVGDAVIYCACGKPSGHQGWCSIRFQQSPARQDWLARCNAQSALRLANVVERSKPLLTTWPFARSFDNDEYHLMKIVNAWLPLGLPEHVRADAGQEALLDILSGTSLQDARAKVPFYIKQAYKFFPSKFTVSLDAPVYTSDGNGPTLADRIILPYEKPL